MDNESQFTKVILPDIALVDMFPSSLVLIENEAVKGKSVTEKPSVYQAPNFMAETAMVSEPYEESISISALGKFAKQVLIVVDEPNAVHCSETNLEFLTKILGSVGFGLNDVAIVNRYNQAVSYPQLKQQFPPKAALYFGMGSQEMGMPLKVPMFQVQTWDSCSFVCVPTLDEMNGTQPIQVEMKKQLWTSLKKLFSA